MFLSELYASNLQKSKLYLGTQSNVQAIEHNVTVHFFSAEHFAAVAFVRRS